MLKAAGFAALACSLLLAANAWSLDDPARAIASLPVEDPAPIKGDWLVTTPARRAGVYRDEANPSHLVLSNGLVRRTIRLAPDAGTIALDNLMTGQSMLRGVKPEAQVELDGVRFNIGGLVGQKDYAYLLPKWLEKFSADPDAFHFVGFEVGKTRERFPWKRVRHSADLPWPPPGMSLRLDFKAPSDLQRLAARLTGSRVLPSNEGRSLLLSDNFEKLDARWAIHESARGTASFTHEAKVGELRSLENTCVFAEQKLPVGVRLVECRVNAGTDQSNSYGPGLAVVWANRTVKFYIRPNQKQFGIWDGFRTQTIGAIEPAKDCYLRVRSDDSAVFCESSLDQRTWETVYKIPLTQSLGNPVSIRLGKTSERGAADDYPSATADGICRVGAFRAYGGLDDRALKDATKRVQSLAGVTVSIHYELYDGIPLMSKWMTLHNGSDAEVRLNRFTNEILAVVEAESIVDAPAQWDSPNVTVISDYAFRGMDPKTSNQTTRWVVDPQYTTQVNSSDKTPCMLESRPPIGPDAPIKAGGDFESFRTFELIHDSTDRERKGLAVRRMFRSMAPWVTENPIGVHVVASDDVTVKQAIDQAADVGFEMVVMSFGGGFNIESADEAYIARMKGLVDYAHSKRIELGGYSLLASRQEGPAASTINPISHQPGGQDFYPTPCVGSEWGVKYMRALHDFRKKTGLDLLEHDGSYPGDVCESTTHPGHRGLDDSQWTQWKTISDYYKWCRAEGVYLNVPDSYFMSGSNKAGMGYREATWSLPREQQILHARQQIFDGTWEKTPSMGWMFVPLTQYGGGGAAATIEPLSQHLDAYDAHLANLFGAGVQACYRGSRLYDAPETRAVVKKWVDFYKEYRDILESDLIHVRRADGRDVDCMMHVNPQLAHKGLAVVYNPLDQRVKRTLDLPLYYTGLTKTAKISEREKPAVELQLDRAYHVALPIDVEPHGMTWFLID